MTSGIELLDDRYAWWLEFCSRQSNYLEIAVCSLLKGSPSNRQSREAMDILEKEQKSFSGNNI